MSMRWRDIAICMLLFAGTAAYLQAWPQGFNGFDEGVYLYEAKRALHGDVMYRDFFEILTPGSFYAMALLYALFGVSLETARMGMAVVHGLIGVLVYLICRQTGVRSSLALLAALTHLVLAYPMCPIASPHWITSLVTLVLIAVVLQRPGITGRRALLWGAIAGTLLLVQQHRGVFIAAAAALVLPIDARRAGMRGFSRRAAVAAGSYVAGLLGVVGFVMFGFVAAAGAKSVLRALVWHPLINYRAVHNDTGMWAHYVSTLFGRGSWVGVPLTDLIPRSALIQHLPLVIPLAGVIALRQWWQQDGGAPRRALVVLLIFSTFSILSITYHPDAVHFAFVASVWAALAALLLEMLQGVVERAAPRARLVTVSLVAMLMVGATWQLWQNLQVFHRWFSLQTPTAFGRVDVGRQDQLLDLQYVLEAVRTAGAREIFAFPANPGWYLLTGTDNPTRFQIVLPDQYTDRDQIAEVVATLEARQVPVVILSFYFSYRGLEPLIEYLKRQYELIGPPVAPGGIRVISVYRRRPDECPADLPATKPRQRGVSMCSAWPE